MMRRAGEDRVASAGTGSAALPTAKYQGSIDAHRACRQLLYVTLRGRGTAGSRPGFSAPGLGR